MRRLLAYLTVVFFLAGGFSKSVADDFKLENGNVYQGRASSVNEEGLVVRLDIGGFTERLPWPKVSQETLKKIAEDPKNKQFVDPFIEIPPEVTKKQKEKQKEVVLKPVTRMERETNVHLSSFFKTPAGIMILIVFFGANIYAGYEVAAFKGRPAAIVCAVSAVLPILGPVLFLMMPAEQSHAEIRHAAPVEAEAEAHAPAGKKATGQVGVPSGGGLSVAASKAKETGPTLPQIYKRGETTFNRRFFETKFAGFFRLVPSEAEKDLVIAVKSGKQEVVGRRITRISSNEMHLALLSGGEHMVTFAEVGEVQLRHKDAKS